VAEYGYTVIYDQLAEGGYQVIVPVLPEIVAYGRTLEEALAKKRPLVEELKVTV
jgi:predicted RNase H-like HicB family nuclease